MNVLPVLFEIFGDVAPNIYEYYQYSELPKQQKLRKKVFKELCYRVQPCAEACNERIYVDVSEYKIFWKRVGCKSNYRAMRKGFQSGTYKLLPAKTDFLTQMYDAYRMVINTYVDDYINVCPVYNEFLLMYTAIKLHVAPNSLQKNKVLKLFFAQYCCDETHYVIYDCFEFSQNPKVVPQNDDVGNCPQFFKEVVSMYKHLKQNYATLCNSIHTVANLFERDDNIDLPDLNGTQEEIVKYLHREEKRQKERKH